MYRSVLCAYRIFSNLADKEWEKGNLKEANRLEQIASDVARGNLC